jgi:hypothetical protein
MSIAAIEPASPANRGLGSSAAPRLAVVTGLLSTVVASVVSAALFLPRQSIWTDETTQLGGLTLSPGELVRWLIDGRTHDFGVPADRMPPLSYWLGSAWAHVFGLTTVSLRWFGVVCTAAAVALLFRAANRLFGLRAAVFAAAFLALSPNICVLSVEIRAYPLFLLAATGTIDALAFLLVDRERGGTLGGWVRLGVWLTVACATHFFGLVLSGATWIGLALFFGWSQRRRLAALAALLAVVAVTLVPFVRGSVAASQSGEDTHRLHEIAQLLYRQIGHPAMHALPVTIPIAFAAAALLALFVVGARQNPTLRTLVVILVAGLGVTIAGAFVAHGFSAAKTTYSTWALPFVSLVLAAPTAAQLARGRWIPIAGAVAFLAAETLGSCQLWRHGEHFAHGPMNAVARTIDGVGTQDLAVIHVDSREYPAVFFPIRFVYGPDLTQFVVGTAAPLGQSLDVASGSWRERLDRFRHLLLVRSKQQNGAQLGAQVRHGDRPFDADPTMSQLTASPGWRIKSHQEVLSLVSADLTLLERAP